MLYSPRKERGAPPYYMPLSKVNGYLPERLHEDIKLPKWIDRDEIGFNAQRFVGLMTIAGIQLFDIRGEFERETSQVRPKFGGFGGSDTAVATHSISEERVPIYRLDAADADKPVSPHAERWLPSVVVNLNMAEIAQQILQAGKDSRSVEEWIPYIDSGLRSSLRKQGIEYLMSLNRADVLTYLFMLFVSSDSIVAYIQDQKGVLPGEFLFKQFASIATATYLMMSANVLYNRKILKKKYHVRFTLFPLGPEIDRALMLLFLTQEKLMKPLNSPAKSQKLNKGKKEL
jgi:hypothetical protein